MALFSFLVLLNNQLLLSVNVGLVFANTC